MAAWSGAGAVNSDLGLGENGNVGFNPGAMTVGNRANPFSPFFGEPRRELKLNPYSVYGRENWSLPDAYNGPNDYLLNIMITLIKDEDLWPTRVVLPIRITENENEVRWDEIRFDDTMATPVPEEGVSRLLTQTTNERREFYQRSGVALLLEHGFMKTEKGRMTYQMNLTQIRNAVLEMMYFGVIEALLRSKEYSQAWTRHYGQQARSGSALRGYLGDEVDRYMALQKSEHAFDMIDYKAKKFLKRAGVSPDTWILPEGTGSYLQLVRPENRDYLLAGPAGPAGYRSALDGKPSNAVQQLSINSCTVYESKSFTLPGVPGPVDPLVRERSVGEHYVMSDPVTGLIPPAEYRTAMRNIWVYNERIDGWSELKMPQMLRACCRFDTGGRLYFPPSFKGGDDPFIMPGRRPVYVFGDMAVEHMSETSVYRVAESIWSRFIEDIKDVPVNDRQTILADIENQDDLPAGQGSRYKNVEKFFVWVRRFLPESRLFNAEYAPSWRRGNRGDPTDVSMAAFFFNAIKNLLPADGNGGRLPVDAQLMDVANAKLLFSLPGQNVIEDDGTNIEWRLVFDAFSKVLSENEEATESDAALNRATLDAFIARMSTLGNLNARQAPNDSDQEKLIANLGFLLAVFKRFKQGALSAEEPWPRKAAFVMHTILRRLAKHEVGLFSAPPAAAAPLAPWANGLFQGISDRLNANPLLTNLNRINWDVSPQEVETSLWGDLPEAEFPEVARGGALRQQAPDDILVHQTSLVGAFTIPHLNSQYVAVGSKRSRDAADMGAGPRFGAVQRGRGESAFRARQGGYDDEDDVDPPEQAGTEQNVPGYSAAMAERWAAVKNSGYKTYIKAIMLTLLHTPITESSLLKLLETDTYFPFNFLVFRPNITHQMATGVLLKAGSETGETLIGHADFQLADDVVRKMHYGNFTIYSKSIIRQNDNVYLAEDIISTGYVGGNDVGINTLQTLYGSQDQGPERSLYVALVPLLSDEPSDEGVAAGASYPNPMDLTGRFANNVPHLQNLDLEIGNARGLDHYPGAKFYAQLWRKSNTNQALERGYVYAQSNRTNTITFQGHQNMYNPSSQRYDAVITNTGHHGPRVYPGCGAVRRMGSMKYLEPISYTSSFGGTMNMTKVGV